MKIFFNIILIKYIFIKIHISKLKIMIHFFIQIKLFQITLINQIDQLVHSALVLSIQIRNIILQPIYFRLRALFQVIYDLFHLFILVINILKPSPKILPKRTPNIRQIPNHFRNHVLGRVDIPKQEHIL